MNAIFDLSRKMAINEIASTNYMVVLAGGLLGGMAIGLSSFMQGKAGAASADALAETGKGFGNFYNGYRNNRKRCTFCHDLSDGNLK